jgi:hypothetical protein
MRFVLKAMLMAGLVLGGLVSSAKAEFSLLVRTGGTSYTNPDGTSVSGGVFTLTAAQVPVSSTDVKDTFTLSSTGAGIVQIGATDLLGFSALASACDYTITTSVKKTLGNVSVASFTTTYTDATQAGLNALTVGAQLTNTPQSYDLTANGYNPSAGPFNLATVEPGVTLYGLTGSAITFGASGGTVVFTVEVTGVQCVPEPTSILIGLVGLPFMGGLVGLVRRRAKGIATIEV